MTELTNFVWNAISSGVLGNAAYDSLKIILQGGFNRLSDYAARGQRAEFNIALQMLLDTDMKIRDKLEQIASGVYIVGDHNISGTIHAGRDVIIGNGNNNTRH